MRAKRTHVAEVEAFTTKDGSTIRELMHPAHHASRNQSLAEATVPVGGATALHLHRVTEEVYHFTSGEGEMTLGDVRFPVRAGDTVCIPPLTPHRVRNVGTGPLVLLCACAPAYSDEDTELL